MTYFRAYFTLLAGLLLGMTALADPLRVAKERYITELAKSWESFEVCEFRTRRDRKSFFAERLELPVSAISRVLGSQELVLKREPQGKGHHLGIVALELSTTGDKALQPAAKARYMAGTKILTRYVVLRQGQRALVVYSENHLDPGVGTFLDGLPAVQGQIWGDDTQQ